MADPFDYLNHWERGFTPVARTRLDHWRRYFRLPAQPSKSDPKIVGILLLPNKEEIPLISGEHGGPWAGAQRGHLPRGTKGYTMPHSGTNYISISHIEAHAAAELHRRVQRGETIKRAVLLIEKAPCGACDNPSGAPAVANMLPPGVQLDVIDPDARTVYRSTHAPQSKIGALPAKPGSSGGARLRLLGGAGKHVAGGIAGLLFGILAAHLRAKVEQDSIDRQIKDLEPKIQKELASCVAEVARLQSAGQKAFANISIEIWTPEITESEPSGPFKSRDTPVVLLRSVTVSDRDIKITCAPGQERIEVTGIGKNIYEPHTYSFEIGLDSEEIKKYEQLKADLQWYERAIQKPSLTDEEKNVLYKGKIEAEGRMRRWLQAQ